MLHVTKVVASHVIDGKRAKEEPPLVSFESESKNLNDVFKILD